jgi:hypothetical protein
MRRTIRAPSAVRRTGSLEAMHVTTDVLNSPAVAVLCGRAILKVPAR